MKRIYALLALFAVSVSLGAPANKTLNVPIYENTATSFVGRAFTVSGNNNKVLGITSGDWALVSPLFGTSPTITTSILTDSTTFAVFNTTATTVNAFGAATTLNVGTSAATVLNFGGAATAAQFRFLEPSGSGANYTGFKAQAQAGNITYTLPAADGTNGQFLKTNGTGTLSWGTASGGGGGLTGSEGGNGAADAGLAALFDAGGGLTSSDGFSIVKSTGGYGANFDPDALTASRSYTLPDANGELATKEWVSAQGFGGTLTSTYIGYGDGTNALTGEAAFNYTAASDLLTVPNLTVSGTATLGTLDITTLDATSLEIGGIPITASAVELNRMVGVTSAVQTQLDAKAASTSPAITTSITTPSTTFALANTTATTVNAFGAATTLNVGANAATVLNLGGATSSAELRFIEPGGSNYTGLKAQAQAGNVTYTLPAADGSSGQVLSTNGTGALSWATASGLPASPTFGDQIMTNGTAGFNGNLSSVFEFKEEFVTASAANPFGPWQKGGTVATDFNFGDQNHWGVVRNRSTSVAVQSWYTGVNHFNFGASTAMLEWIIKTPSTSAGAAAVSDGTDTYTMVVGFGDSATSAASQVDGCFFRYTHSVNSGKWERVTRSNTSNEKAGDTGVTFAGNTWYRLGIKVTNATAVDFYIDGVSVGTNSVGADIPNGAGRETGLMYMCDRTAGTAERNMYVDACRLVMIPTTPR